MSLIPQPALSSAYVERKGKCLRPYPHFALHCLLVRLSSLHITHTVPYAVPIKSHTHTHTKSGTRQASSQKRMRGAGGFKKETPHKFRRKLREKRNEATGGSSLSERLCSCHCFRLRCYSGMRESLKFYDWPFRISAGGKITCKYRCCWAKLLARLEGDRV
jgi:hypothetical protein